MKTTLQLASILFFGTILGLAAYTKLTSDQPAAVAFNVPPATPRPERLTDEHKVPSTDRRESDPAQRLPVLREAQSNRQALPPSADPSPAASAVTVIKSHTVREDAVAPQEVVEQPLVQPETTPVTTPAEAMVNNEPVVVSSDAAAAASKKKRRFFGIFPLRHKG